MPAQGAIGTYKLMWYDFHQEGGDIPGVESLPKRAHRPL